MTEGLTNDDVNDIKFSFRSIINIVKASNEEAEKTAEASEKNLTINQRVADGVINLQTSFKEQFESFANLGDRVGDLRSAFKSDIDLLTGPLSALNAIPGVQTALNVAKLALAGLLKLGKGMFIRMIRN